MELISAGCRWERALPLLRFEALKFAWEFISRDHMHFATNMQHWTSHRLFYTTLSGETRYLSPYGSPWEVKYRWVRNYLSAVQGSRSLSPRYISWLFPPFSLRTIILHCPKAENQPLILFGLIINNPSFEDWVFTISFRTTTPEHI